jgi:hypothetical protein
MASDDMTPPANKPLPPARDEGPLPVINIDEDPWNRDWLKRTWDLGIDNVEEVRRFHDDTRQTVEAFKQLPVYIWNVNKPGMEWLKNL